MIKKGNKPGESLIVEHHNNNVIIMDETGNKITLSFSELKSIYKGIVKIENRDTW